MLINGDSLQVLKEYEDNTFDLIVTDPPYGIAFMGKDWDKALPSQKIWKECFRVLKEGKMAFIMCSPRQDVLSRMIISLEDAGFRTNYTSIYWTYASGFPKAANISKLIDKKAKAEREIIGEYKHPRSVEQGKEIDNSWKDKTVDITKNNVYGHDNRELKERLQITKPATEEAKKMEGAYVGFQPKPAVEVILTVSKGKSLTWLDDCRIPYSSDSDKSEAIPQGRITTRVGNFAGKQNLDIERNELNKEEYQQKGRFPANLLVSDDVLNDGKIRKCTPYNYKEDKIFLDPKKGWHDNKMTKLSTGYNDSGSYSRYFDLDKWYSQQQPKQTTRIRKRGLYKPGKEEQSFSGIDQYPDSGPAITANVYPFIITPKASKSERNKGCEGLPEKRALGYGYNPDSSSPANGMFDDRKTVKNNNHPTVKPLKLMSYLITMGSREGDLVLDPFVGSGTTYIAALTLNRKAIGIELNKDYYEIAQARIVPYLQQTKLM